MLDVFSELGLTTIVVITAAALVTSAIHGSTGIAGGFLMTAILAVIIGVKPVVPVISVALLISHASRVYINRSNFDASAFWAVALPALPCIILAAWLYGKLSSSVIAIVLGIIILASIPMRHWAASRKVYASRKTLNGVGTVYGFLSGASVGPGMLLVPFMLGYGLTREKFVSTLAAIALATNITRTTVFGATSLLDTNYIGLGIFIGLITIPGNMLGRALLKRMNNRHHGLFVDILTVVGALNFFWLAMR